MSDDDSDPDSEGANMPQLVPRPDGRGALLSGGMPGNRGGVGNPPSKVKAMLRLDFDSRRHILREIVDGLVRIRIVPKCAKCGHEDEQLSEAEIKQQLPSVSDRIQAMRVMAQFSDLGDSGLPDDGLLQELAQAVVEEVGGDPWPRIEARWVELLARRVK